ncbi:MAG: Glutamate synthase (NADPH) large chain precursor [Elusimicrobia bacterium ADurb.Bin231]|nr:MAG: Glutamate synthase (NADPH) large chain precursor [Elusimicrobia bacterium ADurb.Bin231]
MGCSIAGVIDGNGSLFSGDEIIRSIQKMFLRANGLGGGFAGYGIYPENKNDFCFHVIYKDDKSKDITDAILKLDFDVVKSEPIPTKSIKEIINRPILWRYFLQVSDSAKRQFYDLTEEEIVMRVVMKINSGSYGSFIISSGKNMGIFKGVGYASEIGRFFRLEEYSGYCWIAHDRFPTNTPGWWAGAHPFGLLNFSLVHNGEISSYGINKRYLEEFGYQLPLRTDSEAILYLFDLLLRKHSLPLEIAYKILCPPLWHDIDIMPAPAREFYKKLRVVYSGALINGPSAIIVADGKRMCGFTDRIKLRPLIHAACGSKHYLASEECAIREICPVPDELSFVKSGELTVCGIKGKIK